MMRARLKGDDDGNPMIACFSSCKDSIRTIPVLQHDVAKPEDLDTEAEDHAADDWRYACMSRPWARKAAVAPEPLRGPVTISEMIRMAEAKTPNRKRI